MSNTEILLSIPLTIRLVIERKECNIQDSDGYIFYDIEGNEVRYIVRLKK